MGTILPKWHAFYVSVEEMGYKSQPSTVVHIVAEVALEVAGDDLVL